METMMREEQIINELLYRYEGDNGAHKYISVKEVAKSKDIYSYIDSNKYYMCLLGGIAYLEEMMTCNTESEREVINTALLFENKLYDLSYYFVAKDSIRKLIILKNCKVLIVEKIYADLIFESGFFIENQTFSEFQTQSMVQELQRRIHWLSLPAEKRMYEVIAWCIYNSKTGALPKCITQEILAKIIQASREYVNSLLNGMQKKDIITLKPIEIKQHYRKG